MWGVFVWGNKGSLCKHCLFNHLYSGGLEITLTSQYSPVLFFINIVILHFVCLSLLKSGTYHSRIIWPLKRIKGDLSPFTVIFRRKKNVTEVRRCKWTWRKKESRKNFLPHFQIHPKTLHTSRPPPRATTVPVYSVPRL